MHDLSSCVSSNPFIRSIADLLPAETYLVGGCIRDMLLGHDPSDLDLVTYSNIEELAASIAARLHARPFWMDVERGVMRIAVKGRGSLDISKPKGKDIEADLISRDLTINAMAYEISKGIFLDPASGLKDLLSGVVRIISERNLLDDPLRALRAVRFSVTLDFAIQEETSRMIRKHADLLKAVSPERIKQEIFRALDSSHGAKFFRLLVWTGLIHVLFPGSLTGTRGPHQLWQPIFSLALPVSYELDGLIHAAEALMPGSTVVLDQETERGVTKAALLRFTAFLLGLRDACGEDAPYQGGHGKDSFADLAAGFCLSLRFSSSSTRMVRTLLTKVNDTRALLSRADASPLGLYRFCEETADCLPEILFLSLAWAQAHNVILRQEASTVWEYYRSTYLLQKKNPLVTGRDIMETLKAPSGPEVGKLLRQVEEARAQGVLQTRLDALKFLQGIAS